MKNLKLKTLLTLALVAVTVTAAIAQVSPGDINRLRGLVLNVKSIVATSETVTTQNGTTYNVGASGTAGTMNIFPATAANGTFVLSATNNSNNFAETLTNAAVGQATKLTLPDPGAATANVLLSAGAQTITGANTFGTGGSLVGKISGFTYDLDPAFSATLLGNPVSRTVVGSCTVTQVNAGCTIITGATGRVINVSNFDLVATGTPATCTGVYLEDAASVKAATVLVAALTSGTHALPLAANVGAGFGSTGLTSGSSLTLTVDGSACTTMTALAYSVTYTVQ